MYSSVKIVWSQTLNSWIWVSKNEDDNLFFIFEKVIIFIQRILYKIPVGKVDAL